MVLYSRLKCYEYGNSMYTFFLRTFILLTFVSGGTIIMRNKYMITVVVLEKIAQDLHTVKTI